MKVKTINYQKVFPLAQYVNERIGIEIELSDGDNEELAFINAKELVHSWADERSQLHDSSQFANHEPGIGIQISRQDIEPEQKKEVTPEEILSCKNMGILQTYRYVKDTNPELKRAYEMKLEELSTIKK